MYEYYNPNPAGIKTGDCAVRAIAKILGVDWDTAYMMLCVKGLKTYDMPNSNAVINALLHELGYERHVIPNTCPACYTIGEFTDEHPEGRFVVGTGTHVVAIEDGTAFDSWDSRGETAIFFWTKEREE